MRILILLLFVIPISNLLGQPELCDPQNATMTSLCEDACIVCNIDGFSGRHEGDISDTLPDDFCTNNQHNGQWIAFIAGSVDLSIELTTSNCDIGAGLEVGIYESFDCINHQLVSECLGAQSAIAPGVPTVFSSTMPLVIGQYYYLVMDGGFGDNCDWTFRVVEGSTEVDPLTVTSQIEGPTTSCPDVLQTYFTEPETGAIIFDWTLDGVPVGDNLSNELAYAFDAVGTFELCVTARNVCDEATPTCQTIQVVTIPTTMITDQFCNGDCYELEGMTICEGGDFEFNFTTALGCDSIVLLTLIELEQPTTNLDIDICEGDTIFVGNNPYSTSGIFEENLMTITNCDSIVTLDLSTIVCTIQTDFMMTPVICNGTASGMLNIDVIAATPPLAYQWQHLQSQITGNGMINSLTDQVQLTNLLAGTYVINIDDGFGNQDVIIAEVTEPAVLENQFSVSDYNGFEVSCFDASDGTLLANPTGGVPPYNYNWSNGGLTQMVDGLSAENYEVVITDDIGCDLTQNIDLTSPDELVLDVNFENPNCDGLETGTIALIGVTGGVGSYAHALDEGNFGEQTIFENLGPANYTYHLKDNNDCATSVQGNLIAPDIPMIELGENINVPLGTSTTLDVFINQTALQTIEWIGTDLSCTDCLEPIIQPFDETSYTLTVTSIDGCVGKDSISVFVDKFRQIYVPNIFSPNLDGINDHFNVFGGVEVESYDLTVFDRWGGVVFSQNDLTRNSNGWDGRFKGEFLNSGLYLWMANVHFIDRVNIIFSGDISLIR